MDAVRRFTPLYQLETFTRSELNWNDSDTEGGAAWGDFLQKLTIDRSAPQTSVRELGFVIEAKEANLSDGPVSRSQDLGDIIYESANSDSLELRASLIAVALTRIDRRDNVRHVATD
jgi:hypothetical protein